MATPSEYERKNRRNIAALQARIDRIFRKAAEEAARIGISIHDLPEGRIFSFDDYPKTLKQVERLLDALHSSVQTTVTDGIRLGWSLADDKNDALVRRVFGTGADSLTPAQQRIFLARNADALEAFIARKTAGLNLSDRVWRYTNAFRSEIEMGLDIGIRDGLPASQMARELKKYLQHPDKLFRRVRDKHGMLRLSKAAAAFHPGRGVYRSSYKNARRLAATETNIAYRTSDHERWQQLDFVVGIEVHLSGNHTCLGRDGKMHELTDICDDLAGKYPKDFKFTGWHPLCRCFATPIMKTDKEMAEENRRILRGEEPLPSSDSVNIVRDVPEAFKSWIENNQERAKGWASMPMFIRDNPQYVPGFRVNTYSAAEKQFTRARHTGSAMKDSVALLLDKKYPGIKNTEKAALIDYTRGDVSDFRHLNKQLMKGKLSDFNAAFSELLSSALSKLPAVEATVYRTIRLNRTRLDEWRLKAASEAETVFEGFTSTSIDFDAVKDFILKKAARRKNNETDVILIIKGKTGRRISEFSKFPEQQEVLFDKGMKLRFRKSEMVNGRFCFYLDEI
jgi:hypothetical protein